VVQRARIEHKVTDASPTLTVPTAKSDNAPTWRDGDLAGDDPRSAGALAYDSAERRTVRAAELRSVADGEAVEAQMAADHCQATPATAAVVNGGPRRAPTARKAAPGTSRDRSRQQAGR